MDMNIMKLLKYSSGFYTGTLGSFGCTMLIYIFYLANNGMAGDLAKSNVTVIGFYVSILFAIIGIMTIVNTLKKISKLNAEGTKVTATVSKVIKSKNNFTFNYSYNYQNEDHSDSHSLLRWGFVKRRYNVGDEVPILVLKENEKCISIIDLYSK